MKARPLTHLMQALQEPIEFGDGNDSDSVSQVPEKKLRKKRECREMLRSKPLRYGKVHAERIRLKPALSNWCRPARLPCMLSLYIESMFSDEMIGPHKVSKCKTVTRERIERDLKINQPNIISEVIGFTDRETVEVRMMMLDHMATPDFFRQFVVRWWLEDDDKKREMLQRMFSIELEIRKKTNLEYEETLQNYQRVLRRNEAALESLVGLFGMQLAATEMSLFDRLEEKFSLDETKDASILSSIARATARVAM